MTETEIKLEDAHIQLQLAMANLDNEDVFRSCINSFCAFARSITMVMQKETGKNAELLQWYKSKTAEFANNPLMKFFNEQRVHTIHRGNVKPKAHSMPVRNTEGQPKADEPMMSIWVFDNVQKYLPDETGNVFRLCDQYIEALAALVQEWRYRKDVIESPRVVIDELQADQRRMKGQILAMGNELQQAKLTLELVRDVLKNAKGDESIDSLIRDVVVRIERLLNPEKFRNARAIQHEKGTHVTNQSGKLVLYTILVSPTEADGKGAEGVYATIRNDYAKDENGNSIFDKSFGFWMWGTALKGPLPPVITGFTTAKETEEAAFRIYKTLRY